MKGKRRVWMMSLLGLFLVALIGTLTVVTYAKISADETARRTVPELKSYINAVVVAARASDDPATIVSEVDSVNEPSFKHVPLGEISSEYVAAQKKYDEVMAKVKDFSASMQGFAQTLAYHDQYKKDRSDLASLEASITSKDGRTKNMQLLEEIYLQLQVANKHIKAASVSSDYVDQFTELGRVYGSMELNIEGVTYALKQNSEDSYRNMYVMYETARSQVPRTESDLESFVSSIPTKINTARDGLERYGSEL